MSKRKEEHRKTHVFGFRVKCDSVVADGKVTGNKAERISDGND